MPNKSTLKKAGKSAEKLGKTDVGSDTEACATWPTKEALVQLETLAKLEKEAQRLKREGTYEDQESEIAHEKRLASEKLGEEAAKWYLQDMLGKDIPECEGDSIGPGCFAVFSGPHTVNIFYQDPDPPEGSGKVYVLEAKGGRGKRGSRKGRHPPNKGRSLTQGQKPYLTDVTKTMAQSGDERKMEAVKRIKKARKKGQLKYIGVRGRYDRRSATGNIKTPRRIPSFGF